MKGDRVFRGGQEPRVAGAQAVWAATVGDDQLLETLILYNFWCVDSGNSVTDET